MAEFSGQPNFKCDGLLPHVGMVSTPGMAKSGPHRPKQKAAPPQWRSHFIKEWRIYREMTVEALAEASGMSTGNISALENRRQGYSDQGLEKLAKALRTTPAALLYVNPLDPKTGDFWRFWEMATPSVRETLTIMAARLVEPTTPKP